MVDSGEEGRWSGYAVVEEGWNALEERVEREGEIRDEMKRDDQAGE